MTSRTMTSSKTIKRGRGHARPHGFAPLCGIRVLVGRARHQASELSSGLRDLGAEVLQIPFIEIRKSRSHKPLDAALKNLSVYDWLIFTSVNGVDAFWKRLRELRIQVTHLRRLKIAAIGPATRRAIQRHGLKVDVMPKEYVAESVVKSLRQKVSGKHVLLARAKVARDVIPRELRKLGAHVEVVEAYEIIVPQASRRLLRVVLNDPQQRPDVITFTSSSTVKNFMVLLERPRGRGSRHIDLLADAKLASIGPVTSSTLRELGLPVDIEAQRYNIPGLIEAITAHQRRNQ
jgi:uroporphyrinogen-III synthase